MFRYMGYRELWLRGRLSHVCRGLSLEVGQGERGMSMLACILRLSAISLALADGVMCQWQLFKFASASSSDLWLRVLCDGQTTISAHGAAQRSSSEKQLSISLHGCTKRPGTSSAKIVPSTADFRWNVPCRVAYGLWPFPCLYHAYSSPMKRRTGPLLTISAHGAAQSSSSVSRYTDARRGLAPAARRSSFQLLISVGTFCVV